MSFWLFSTELYSFRHLIIWLEKLEQNMKFTLSTIHCSTKIHAVVPVPYILNFLVRKQKKKVTNDASSLASFSPPKRDLPRAVAKATKNKLIPLFPTRFPPHFCVTPPHQSKAKLPFSAQSHLTPKLPRIFFPLSHKHTTKKKDVAHLPT